MSLERPLRLLTYLATAITFPLNIVATVLSLEHQRQRWHHRHITAFCLVFVPLAMTVVTSSISLQYMRKHGKSPCALRFKILDLLSAFGYIGVLIPCWALEIQEFSVGSFGLLIGYTTAPMILNLFIHLYFSLNEVPKKLRSMLAERSSSCQQCPHCKAKLTSSTTKTAAKKGYSLLRGEDYLDIEADPIQYRDSDDFLGEGAERAEQAEQAKDAKQPEEGGKSKDMVEV